MVREAIITSAVRTRGEVGELSNLIIIAFVGTKYVGIVHTFTHSFTHSHIHTFTCRSLQALAENEAPAEALTLG